MSKPWLGVELSGGRYRLVSQLGEGAMGTVYRAHDRNLDAEVVVKIPLDAMLQDPDFAPRFDREIRALVKLSHPHIVKVSDFGNHEGTPFAVMQYLLGGDMDNRRRRLPDGSPGPMPPDSLASWLPDIANALDFMHVKGYVHRDIKPTNILFDDNNQAYLADFGVVGVLANTPAAATRAMTTAGLVIGTPEYMAPEIIMGEPFDGRADQYSLAVMVYELLAGRRPFEGTNATALIVQQSTQPPPPLGELAPRVSEGLAKVIHRALEKHPASRFESCAAFAKEVVSQASRIASPEVRQVPCPSCGATLKVSDKYVGKRLRCPTCKTPLGVLNDLSLEAAHDSGSNATLKIDLEVRVPTPLSTVRPGTPQRVATQKLDRGGLGGESAKRPGSSPTAKANDPAEPGKPAWKKAVPIAAGAVLTGVVIYLLVPKPEPAPPVEIAKVDATKEPAMPPRGGNVGADSTKSATVSKSGAEPQPARDTPEPPAQSTVDSTLTAVLEKPVEPAPEIEKAAERSRLKLNAAALVELNFEGGDMREGRLPEGWGGSLRIARDERSNRLALGLAEKEGLGDARVSFGPIEGEFVCEFEFLLPKARNGSLFDLYLSGKIGKEVRQMLRLEFNASVPGQFYCHASKKRKAYSCDFRDNTFMRVRLERSKGKQLKMTLNGRPLDNFHPVLFGSIDRAVLGLQSSNPNLQPQVTYFMISR